MAEEWYEKNKVLNFEDKGYFSTLAKFNILATVRGAWAFLIPFPWQKNWRSLRESSLSLRPAINKLGATPSSKHR